MKGRGNSAPIEGYLGSEGAAEYLGLTPMRCISWSRTGSCHSSESAEAGLIVVHGHVAVGETFRLGSLATGGLPPVLEPAKPIALGRFELTDLLDGAAPAFPPSMA